jgi:hypothetical protein
MDDTAGNAAAGAIRAAQASPRLRAHDLPQRRTCINEQACIRAWCCGERTTAGLLVGLGLDDLLAAVKAAGADVMATMRLSGRWFDGERRLRQEIVRAMHAALRRRLLVLLDSHFRFSR